MKHETAIVTSTFAPELRALVDSRWAPNTQRVYRVGWARFEAWCKDRRLAALPATAETVCKFLADQSTAYRHLSRISASYGAIRWVHVRRGLPSPTSDDRVRLVMSAVKKKLGSYHEGREPLRGDALVRTIKAIERDALVGKRDAALILVGFWLALRRDSLRHLRAEPAFRKTAEHGYSLLLDRSKTDQEGQGAWLQLERRRGSILCPVGALNDWLAASKIAEGPIFVKVGRSGAIWKVPLTGQAIARIIKTRTAAAGLESKAFSGHSMRSGFVTEALEQGASTAAVRDVTGHTSDAMLLRYWRHFGAPSQQSPARRIKLKGETDG